MFLQILQNWQENTYIEAGLKLLLKKNVRDRYFPVIFTKFFWNTFVIEHFKIEIFFCNNLASMTD